MLLHFSFCRLYHPTLVNQGSTPFLLSLKQTSQLRGGEGAGGLSTLRALRPTHLAGLISLTGPKVQAGLTPLCQRCARSREPPGGAGPETAPGSSAEQCPLCFRLLSIGLPPSLAHSGSPSCSCLLCARHSAHRPASGNSDPGLVPWLLRLPSINPPKTSTTGARMGVLSTGGPSLVPNVTHLGTRVPRH